MEALMKRKASLISAGVAAVLAFASSSWAQTVFTQKAEFNVPEANQGIAADKHFFYAIDDATIAKYTKTGKFVAKWQGEENGPIVHLDSGVVIDSKQADAHSKYPQLPMTSEIEVWDTATLQHIGSHSIGISLGSMTWLDLPCGSWYRTFANYDRTVRMPAVSNTEFSYAQVPEI